MLRHGWTVMVVGLFLAGVATGSRAAEEGVFRLGLIGLDTSHVIAFTNMLNDPDHPDHVPGCKVVAGFKGGSPEIESSISRVEGYTQQLQDRWGVRIYDTIEELCENVDGVLLESVSGLPHLEQARPVIAAGLPLFIDKPLAGSLADALEIARLAKAKGVPWFSASSLRFWSDVQKAASADVVGDVLGCDAYSPCAYEPHHPDLFWYGIHGVEILYTVMGSGCKEVTRVTTPDTDFVVGLWSDGRIGTFRGTRKGNHGYGCTTFGTKGNYTASGHSYKGLMEALVQFFKTGEPPFPNEVSLEILAFMEAAREAKDAPGKPVALPSISLE
ncbi:MAG: Gfo/Idh/MocA family oxidoreductase [Verrucomicrobiota bacterium]|nr:Gfo/Idh/MocA family oxidoreductase [Verrucomicrobiota bacterium]